jgi:hypothetical protein
MGWCILSMCATLLLFSRTQQTMSSVCSPLNGAAELEPGTRAAFCWILLTLFSATWRTFAPPARPLASPGKVRISVDWREGFFVTNYLHTTILGSCMFVKDLHASDSPLPAQRYLRGVREMASWASRHFDVRESTISKFCFPNRNTLFLWRPMTTIPT